MVKINSLNIRYDGSTPNVNILYDVSFSVNKGEILGIAGESGSGKSVLAKYILGIGDSALKITSGRLNIAGKNIITVKDYESIRGSKVSMIFQDPLSSLNPSFTIGNQLIETIRLHDKITYDDAKKKAIRYLEEVEITMPIDRLNAYPHQLSGGMSQRIMIALALATNPDLLIADEPTTALDVIIERQIINLLLKLNKKRGLSIIFITHDLSLLENIADRVLILYSGEVLEILTGEELRTNQMHHPYSIALKSCIPDMHSRGELTTIRGSISKNTEDMINCCIFAERCNIINKRCKQDKPEFINNVKCFYPVTDI